MRKAINLLIIGLLIGFVSCQNGGKKNVAFYENSDQLLEAVKAQITEVGSEDFKKMYDGEGYIVLIDVRETNEYEAGYIPGAVSIPRGLLEFKIGKEDVWDEFGLYIPQKTDSIVVYCRTGGRSALAARSLMEMGYANVKSLKGGWVEWSEKYPELREQILVEQPVPSETAPSEAAPAKKEKAGGC
jgi:rhodanese-related sulfurtransferase